MDGVSAAGRPNGVSADRGEAALLQQGPGAGRNIDVYRGDQAAPLWSAATLNWSNQPPWLGRAATNAATTRTAGWQDWVVTGHVLAQYTNGNNGFVLRDRAVNSATFQQQHYYDRQHTTYTPTLVLT